MNPKTLQFIEELQKAAQGGAVQPDELIKISDALIKMIRESSASLSEDMAQQRAELEKSLENLRSELLKSDGDVSRKITVLEQNLRSELRTTTRMLEQKVNDVLEEIPPQTDLRPMEERLNRRLSEIENKIPILPEEKNVEGMIQEVRDEMNIKLEEYDRKIATSGGGRGGGTSAIGVRQMFKYIAHTEAPTGAINGVNTTYTVKNPIWFIFGFTLNGEQIAELPNFTYSGNTITFSSAIPAAYAGMDFECKYIG